jgi:hypothetical protein
MTIKAMTTQQEEQLQILIDRAEVAYERAQVPDGETEYDLEAVEAAEENIFAYVTDLLAEKDALIAELKARLNQADESLERFERNERAFDEMNAGWEKAEAEALADGEDEDIDPDDISSELHDFLTDRDINPATLTHKRLELAERQMNREKSRRERAETED